MLWLSLQDVLRFLSVCCLLVCVISWDKYFQMIGTCILQSCKLEKKNGPGLSSILRTNNLLFHAEDQLACLANQHSSLRAGRVNVRFVRVLGRGKRIFKDSVRLISRFYSRSEYFCLHVIRIFTATLRFLAYFGQTKREGCIRKAQSRNKAHKPSCTSRNSQNKNKKLCLSCLIIIHSL